MKSAVYFPPEYFLKYKEKPVVLKPYTVKQGKIGELYLKKVKDILKGFDLPVTLRGSTAYKISGKGDVEVGVYPRQSDWVKVIDLLKKNFGEPENNEKDYARFNFIYSETEVEIIVLKGRVGQVDLKLQEYLIGHPKLLKEYEQIKKKYSFSKREYNFRKNEFLRRVEETIPEN